MNKNWKTRQSNAALRVKVWQFSYISCLPLYLALCPCTCVSYTQVLLLETLEILVDPNRCLRSLLCSDWTFSLYLPGSSKVNLNRFPGCAACVPLWAFVKPWPNCEVGSKTRTYNFTITVHHSYLWKIGIKTNIFKKLTNR